MKYFRKPLGQLDEYKTNTACMTIHGLLHLIQRTLTKEYPVPQKKPSYLSILKTALTFVAFIFVINLLAGMTLDDVYVCLLFSLVMTLTFFINYSLIPIVFPTLFNESNWKVWTEVLWIAFHFVSIAFYNLLFFWWLDITSVSWGEFANFFSTTCAIGIGPVIALVIYEQNRLLKKNLQLVLALNESITDKRPEESGGDIVLQSDHGLHALKLNAGNLILLESADNYVKVYFLHGTTVQTELIRIPLKRAEEELKSHAEFVRCHRAFIVNINHLVSARGNAQGLQITVDHLTETIPVSRNYVEAFRRILS